MKLTLPTDSAERKEYPLFRGCDMYFPAALAGVARHSFISNEKHNPGEPMHHSRGKSADHADCIRRHLVDLADMLAACGRIGESPEDGRSSHDEPELIAALLAEANALAWRALALSQELHERFGNAPLAPAAFKFEELPAARRSVAEAAERVRHYFEHGPALKHPGCSKCDSHDLPSVTLEEALDEIENWRVG
jgi:hypothetical protein